MRKQFGFLLLFWAFGCTLFFFCDALAAANPSTNYSSDDLGSTNVITDSSQNLGERTAYDPFAETGEGGFALGGPPPLGSLVADFGAMGALCRYGPSSGWRQLTPVSSNLMLASLGGLVANFPGHGLYHYDGTTWTLLTWNSSVENLLAIYGWLYADFGSLGLWKYDGEWHNLSYANPNKMQAYRNNLVANFPGQGLFEHNGTAWSQLTPDDTVQALIEIQPHILYADYGTLGLWKYDGSWARITSADANLLGSYGRNLVANFPGCGGLYQYDGITWTQLTPNDAVQALIEVEGGILFADYGTLGLWKYDGSWARITSADANLLGSYAGLVANFPGYGGLYQYKGSSWQPLTSNSGVTNMVRTSYLP
jgi:hypothetical protein